MKFLWLIFQSIISTWVLLLCFYLVMHDWQHFWTRFQGRLWKLVHIFDIRRGVRKLAWGRIKRTEGKNGCTGRDTNDKWRTQEIWIFSLSGWGPWRFTAQLKNQAPSGAKQNGEVQARHAAALCKGTAVLHSTQTSKRIVPHRKKACHLKAENTPLNSSQNVLQLCLKKTGLWEVTHLAEQV